MTPELDKPALMGGSPVRPEGPPGWPVSSIEIERGFAELIRSGDWGQYHGPHCPALVEALQQFHQCAHAVLYSSGTAAIEMALRGLGVGPGDEVILSAYDFKANFQNVLVVGATPVLVDVRNDNLQIDETLIAGAVSDKTRAILVSHLHGAVVDMPAVRQIADERGISVIEDACQMPGAIVSGRIAGRWGDVGVLSFGGSKLLTAGRGGAIVTDRDDIVQRMRLYTQRGNEAYPLSELQAALLVPQLELLAEWNEIRASNVAALTQRLGESSGLRPLASGLAMTRPSYYKVGFWYDAGAFAGLSRERFCEAMRAEGFAVDAGFRGLHLIHSRKRFRAAEAVPNADWADESIVMLHHPILLEESDWPEKYVLAVEKIRRFADDLQT